MTCILVIDDAPDLRALFRQMLERAGYVVLEASDGREGLRVCHACPVDLMTTDLAMPGQDGLATIRAVRVLRPTLKIIIISGHDVRSDPQMVHLVERMDVHRILLKPVQRQELLEAVHAVLAEGAGQSVSTEAPGEPSGALCGHGADRP